MNTREILQAKGKEAFTILPTDTIAILAMRLRANKVSVAVVSRDGQSIYGVITERDLVFVIGVHGEGLHNVPVSDIMTKKVITCSPNDDDGQNHSPMLVEKNGKFFGIISIRDVLKERVDQLQQAKAQLRKFVKEASHEPQNRA